MATEKRLIDANALEEVIRHDFYRVNITIADKVMDFIQSAPTVEATEVVHGFWDVNKSGTHKCSVCHDTIPDEQSWCGANYCPYCGAKMDGEGNG